MFHPGDKTDIVMGWETPSMPGNISTTFKIVEEKDMDDKSERHELETVKEQVAEETYGWVGPTTKCVNSHLLKCYSSEYDLYML